MKKIPIVLMIFISLSCKIFSQQYNLTEISIARPTQFLIENYTRVNLPKEAVEDAMLNRFDINNPYTYLQMLNDAAGNIYHIILQTNFTGKLLFLCYSNNLSALFNKADKPLFIFQHCMKEINKHITSVKLSEAAIRCVVDRLNYCSDD